MPRGVAEVPLWLRLKASEAQRDRARDVYTAQVRSITERTKRLAEAEFRASADPRGDLFRGDLGKRALTLSAAIAAAQRLVQQWTSTMMSARVGLAKPVPPDPSFLLRNGIDKSLEYQRPYRVAAQSFANGMDRGDAIEAGVRRLNALAAVDIQMTKLRQSQLVLETAGIKFYRRRVTGDNPCSLCEIAATKIYATNELMPIHTHCSCEIDPIDIETGRSLSQLQAEADKKASLPSRNGQQQRKIGALLDDGAPLADFRELIQVQQHGEIGPMLTWKGNHWAGPDEIKKLKSVEAQALKGAKEDGGITIGLDGDRPAEGFAFAPRKDTERHKPLSELTIEDIDKYVDDHFELLSEPGNHLGLWVEKGEAYIDVSQVGPADASTIARAQAADQLGVFDLGEFNTIDLGVIDGSGKYVKLGEATDLYDQYRRKVAGADQGRGESGAAEIPTGAGSSTAVGSAPSTYDWQVPGEGPIAYDEPNYTAIQLRARHTQLEKVVFLDDADPRFVNDVATTLDSLIDKYPQSRLRAVMGRKALGTRYAETDVWQPGLGAGEGVRQTEIRVDRWRATSFDAVERDYSRDIEKHYHPTKDGRTAAEAIAAHEFGHTLDSAGSYRATEQASRVLKEKFLELHPELREKTKAFVAPLYEKWLDKQISGYSRYGSGLNPTEAIAEAFAAVEMDPEKATDAEKALHDLLVRTSTMPERSGMNAPGWVNYEALGGTATAPSKTVAAEQKKRRTVTDGKGAKVADAVKTVAADGLTEVKDRVKKQVVSSIKLRNTYGMPGETLRTNTARYGLRDVSQMAPTVYKPNGSADWSATWAQLGDITVNPDGTLSDPIIEANFSRVLEKAMERDWVMASGKVWYPVEFGGFVKRELDAMGWVNPYTGKPFASFEEAMDAASAYAINASWPQTMADFHNWMRGNPPKGNNTVSANKASVGGGTYWLDNARENKRGYKIKDFAENGKGDRETSTTDRHMSRMGLGTNDSEYAGGMLGAAQAGGYTDPVTGERVDLPGYERLSQAIDRVSRAHGLFPDQGQASMWIEFFGVEAAHGLPPDEVIAKGLKGINEWVKEQDVAWRRAERIKLGLDPDLFEVEGSNGVHPWSVRVRELLRHNSDFGDQVNDLIDEIQVQMLEDELRAAGLPDAVVPLAKLGDPRHRRPVKPSKVKRHNLTKTEREELKARNDEMIKPTARGEVGLADFVDQFVADVGGPWPEPPGSEPIRDPLLDLLDGKTADTTTDDIIDLLGGPIPEPKPAAPQPKEEPIPGVREGEERWYKHLKEQEDRTGTAHLVLPTSSVNRYREYDRTEREYETLRKAIVEDGVRLPLWIATDGERAILLEGNHRLAVAKELGIEQLPVRVTYGDVDVIRNQGREPTELTGPFKEWVKANLTALKERALD